MIEFQQVSKQYDTTLALKGLNLTIENGEIGHNGAGKTTTISLLTSIIEATSGQIFVDGMNLAEHRNDIKKKIAYVPDSPDIFLNLTADEYWHFLVQIYDVDKAVAEQRIDQLTKLFDIADRKYETIDSFSHGMRQKVIIIGALVPNPDIWILDEPLTGLDPQASFDLKEMMRKHAESGRTILFSTHILSVAEQLCDRIGILKKGELIFIGTLEKLRQAYPDQNLETIYLQLIARHDEDVPQESAGE
ncbi:ABC transporter ATP-binding protein [Streptococcus sp. X16XC17]|uniref:ABC transporter ATP-binding protein n=1 Tax=unclassified Streptococcus TaxID=2608887 RepID=UPI00066FB4E3|nr:MULTISPECIES: ABC transporter ATP-binding protein [unclassified Streptococcus]TCD46136.1 ABC transporter ATP-binding protein [Streptococcus sp. X16XC17]